MIVKPGDRLDVRSACGLWHSAIATSEIEGIWRYDKESGSTEKIHDFPVVWVRFPGSAEPDKAVPWPADSVRPVETP